MLRLAIAEVSCCRLSRSLTLLNKLIINNLALKYTTDPIPPLWQLRYSLRNQDAIGGMRTKIEKFQFTFYLRCLSEWNNLDPEIRCTPTIATFRTKLL